MSKVICKSRKSQKTCESSELCKWDGQKCSNKDQAPTEPAARPTTAAKPVKCTLRKSQASCESSDLCTWENGKCQFKATTTPHAQVHEHIQAVKEKEKENQNENQVVTAIMSLPNRHCTHTGKHDMVFDTHVRLHDKTYKELYDGTYKSNNMHMGQRKLLMSEIQLLTAYYKGKPAQHPIVLYVGAAPGTHLLTLVALFPHVRFILYDGARFDPKLFRDRRFQLHNEFFDNAKAALFTRLRDPLLLISDIRLSEEKFEAGVVRDMKMQADWVRIIQPALSLLKFRLSYDMKPTDTISYFKGVLLFGIWAKPMSGETRLLIKREDIGSSVAYQFEQYEQTLFYHNRRVRPFCFRQAYHKFKEHMSDVNNAYCPCFDCFAELTVLSDYCKLENRYVATNALDRAIEIVRPPRFHRN